MSWSFLSQKTGLFITNFKQFGSIFADMWPKMCLEFWKSRILELLISIVWSMDKWILAKILSKFASDPGIIFKCRKPSNETIFITFSWFQNRVFISVLGHFLGFWVFSSLTYYFIFVLLPAKSPIFGLEWRFYIKTHLRLISRRLKRVWTK